MQVCTADVDEIGIRCSRRAVRTTARLRDRLVHAGIEALRVRTTSLTAQGVAPIFSVFPRALSGSVVKCLFREYCGVKKLVPEFSIRIVALCKSPEVRELFITRLKHAGVERKQFAPMRFRIERGKFLFDKGQQVGDASHILLQRKVYRDTSLPVAGAHP